ncbi:MAG: OmpA family protein [Prevotellaceae bacterium]|jgi:outer membrane protein OmpA-like peptidoglycan-associated protein|nr:OmpA family protein [Prevotellaceae bacterium]
MKKFITMLAVGVACIGNMAAQSADYAHWSVAVKGGIDYYRVKPDAGQSDWSKGEKYLNNAGWAAPIVRIDYTVNPYYGFGIEGGWFTYNRKGLEASTIDIVFNNEVNLSNLLAPTRKGFWKKGTFYGNAGIGAAFFSKEPWGELGGGAKKEENQFSPVAVASLAYNYNFSSSFALVLEGQYRSYVVDALGTGEQGLWNNDGVSANIGFRFKFHGKGKAHVRDASVKEYYADLYNAEKIDLSPYDRKIQGIENQLGELNNKVDEVEQKANHVASKSDIARLDDKVKQLERDLNNLKNHPVTASFGESDGIKFNTGSAHFTGDSQHALAKIVQTLKDGAGNKKIKIYGYTDNVGSEAYNLKLSQQRAESVKNFLVSRGVSAESITEVKGMGEANPVADNGTAAGRSENRRVSFVIH